VGKQKLRPVLGYKGGGVLTQLFTALAFMHNISMSKIPIVKIPPSFLKEGKQISGSLFY
jgi:hypothetical protein